jgi:PucR C-terminal helix-turn-helix domain
VRPHDHRLHVTEIGSKHVEVHALVLGSAFVGAYLTLAGRRPFPIVARQCIPLLHKAIGTTLLPPPQIDKHQLSWRAELVDAAFRFSLTDAQLDERLAAAGYRNTVVRAFVLTHRLPANTAMDLARFYFTRHCETLLVNIRPHRIDCLLLNPAAEAGTDRGVRGVAIAGGPDTRQRELSTTVTAAHRAVNRNRQQALTKHDELGSLIRSLPDAERDHYVHAVLHDLLDFEQVAGVTDLSTTLAVYLENLGALEPTAAALGVHRHTVRNRLRRIVELTGRDPDNVDDRLALQLALALSGRTRNAPN